MSNDGIMSFWLPPETIPKDREVLIKTTTGIVSGTYCEGEWSHHYYDGDEYTPAVFSCYDDAITIECDWGREDRAEIFPDIIGWMEIPT